MAFDPQNRPLPPAPLVTVGMPLYNDRKYAKAVSRGSGSLGAILLSLLGLTYRCLADFAGSFLTGFASIMRRVFRI